ncbi:PIN domain-containing protein [Delftia tsuruhatensis]|uniref:PIN domain-containing protein n=1 Tax=Delftia tsuruhatensis TaxID=180282 RepID=UPI003A87EC6C
MSTKQPLESQSNENNSEDPTLLDQIYKDPLAAFLHQPQSIEELKSNCLIFLDTNVLLIPYSTSKESLKSFTDIYGELSTQGRLYLADRVMQEFEKNVPDKIKNIFHSIVINQNLNTPPIDFPLLDGITEYTKLKEAEKELKAKIDQYRKASHATLEAIEQWEHNDPVRNAYRLVFAKAKRATITTMDSSQLQTSWSARLKNKIPPGYKDGAKSDSGIGDYLLWQAVLDTCAQQKKSAIIVSSDAKSDWWHISDSRTLYARRELIEEFRYATGGETIKLLSPPDFLKLYGANNSIVKEVQQEQDNAIEITNIKQTNTKLSRTEAIFITTQWIQDTHPGDYTKMSSDTYIRTNNDKTQEFKISYIASPILINHKIDIYKDEEATADSHTIVFFAYSKIMAEAAADRVYKMLKLHIQVIVGYIDDITFIPIFNSKNPNQYSSDSNL